MCVFVSKQYERLDALDDANRQLLAAATTVDTNSLLSLGRIPTLHPLFDSYTVFSQKEQTKRLQRLQI